MRSSEQQRRLLTALSLLLFLLLLWVLTAVQLEPTAAGPSRISISLQPRFSPTEGGQSLGAITLTIVGDVVKDLQLAIYDPGRREGGTQASPWTPAPTATPENPEDDPSRTPTGAQADTPVPADTPQPTATPKPTEPTHTPQSLTPTLTDGSDVSAFTSTPTATKKPDDNQDPKVSEGTLDVEDGSTISCQQTVHVSDLRVFDPEYSAGIKWVKLKYKIEGSSKGYVYSDHALELTSGGWTSSEETEWDGRYKGQIEIEFEEGWALHAGPKVLARAALSSDETATPTPTPDPSPTLSPTPTPTPTPDPEPSATPTSTATKAPSPTPSPTPSSEPYTVELWAIAKDHDGNHGTIQLAAYTMTCP